MSSAARWRAQPRAAAEFVHVSPLRGDLPEEARSEWISNIPGTDTALMMALVHTLVVEGLHDRAFLDRYTVGWPVFERYLLGETDGQPKDAAWAAAITGVAADTIVALARRLHGRRALIVVSHSLQRAEHGEQPVWMGAVLAAALGQIGLPGGGYAYALGAIAYYGRRYNAVPIPTLPQGRNGVSDFIPVARIADMLLNPGGAYRYNGKTRTYPDIRLVYWAGGNPFHHHQDLNRLRRAFAQVDTLVVHELGWTATARHADFVLPATMTLEREDIGGNANDPLLVPMQRIAPPYGEARDDYAIFSDLAERLGAREAFTEGRTVRQWLEHLYEPTRKALADSNLPAPSFDEFWAQRWPDPAASARRWRPASFVSATIPTARSCRRPSGKIEIFSETIASFGEADCPGHPAWLAPVQAPAPSTPLILVANQPATRLHSQLDFGGHSAASKHRGREVARMHPVDAAARGVADGDIIRIFNARGACLAGVRVTDGIRPRRHPAFNRRLVRPRRPPGGSPALRARQSERADARRRHVFAGARLHRATDDGRSRAFQRQSAADPGLRSAGCFQGGCGCQARRLSHGQDRALFHAGNGACGRNPRQKTIRGRNYIDGAGPDRRARAEAECVCASGGGGGDGGRGKGRPRVCQGRTPSARCTAFP